MREIGKRRHAVKGTPTDCAIMGACFLSWANDPPDSVLSGADQAELADDVNYSGTVAGAIEGSLLGIPSIALSQAVSNYDHGVPTWDTPMVHGADLIRKLLDAGWPKGTVINVNFPDCQPDQVRGVSATVQGLRDTALLDIDDRMDTRGKAYYWIGIAKRGSNPPEGSDLWAVRANLISVTPLCLDFTDHEALPELASVLEEKKK